MKWLAITAAGLAACIAFAPAPTRAQSAPPPLPQVNAPTYYYNDNGKPAGPFTLDEMRQKIAAGAITPDTLVWAPGMPGWVAFKTAMGQGSPQQPQPIATGSECRGRHVVMADDFTNPQAWTGNTTSEGHKLKYKATPGHWAWTIYRHPMTGDADICITVQTPHRFNDATLTLAGVILASQDGRNFYAFVVSPTGNAALLQCKNGEFLPPVIQFHHIDDLKTDPGSKNDLRVSVKDGTYTMFVNGTKFDQFKPEAAGGRIGIIVLSEKERADAWKFASLKVTDNQ